MVVLSSPLEPHHRQLGASFTEVWGCRLPASYGAPELEHRAVSRCVGLFDETYRGVLDLRGKECAGFLERVVSSHAEALEPGRGEPSSLLTAKGRMVAAFHLFRLGDHCFRALFFEPLRRSVIDGFSKYALLSDVDVLDRSKEVSILALRGPWAATLLRSFPDVHELPTSDFETRDGALGGTAVSVVRSGAPPGSFELWLARERLATAWKALTASLAAVSADGDPGLNGRPVGWIAAEALRLEAGLARFGLDYGEDTFPQEVGWEGALTFDKCYVGQEVVARLETYGQVSRRLFQVFPDSDTVPAPGCRLLSGEGDEAGQITSAAFSFRHGRPIALAFVKRRFWSAVELALEEEGTSVELRALPGPAESS